jgi:hypothetical protein
MSDQPYFRTDYFRPPTGVNVISPEEERATAAAASRDAAREEMAYLRALGRPPLPNPELPPIKAPIIPQEFEQRVAALDEEIYSRGVAIDRNTLLRQGKERFQQLLAADRKARSLAPVGDLTCFASVQQALTAYEAPSVPVRKMREQAAGSGKERELVRRIAGWSDLWKATQERQETLTDLYTFHDEFAALCFGQSILERLSPDGRLRSRLFCGGRGAKVDLFRDWLSATGGSSLVSVTLLQPLWHLFAWLANEQNPLPSPVDLAKDFFNVRSPSKAQARLAESVFDGFLLGYDGWPLWEYVGRRSRTMQEQGQLATWRTALAKRYPGISSFHAEVSAAFFKDVGFGFDAHRQFEPARYRAFIDSCLQKRLRQVSALLALGLEETFKGAVAARFQGSVLVEGKHALNDKRVQIALPLAKAFLAATFPLEFTEVKP